MTPRPPEHVDPAVVGLTQLTHRVRDAGIPIGTARVHSFLESLSVLPFEGVSTIRAVARTTLCSSPEHLPILDEVLDAWLFPDDDAAPRSPVSSHRITIMDRDDQADGSGEDDPLDIPARSSREELLRHDVATLAPQDREELERLLRLFRFRTPTRRTHRTRRAPSGPLDARATLRAAMRTGGEPAELLRARRRHRHRPVVLLIDVSGSMQDYATTYLRFAHAAVRGGDFPTEVFTLGTRLTRVTGDLDYADPDLALARSARAVRDWQGGTRLGRLLQRFLTQWGQHRLVRGGVVVILSDGWESDDPELLGQQAARLARLTHRVVWANPRRARPGFEPLVGGLVAALPHVDHFVDAHSVHALEELAALLASEATVTRPTTSVA
jgi:uncharacterized protein with von Willebrand factor type A (vWA) domain